MANVSSDNKLKNSVSRLLSHFFNVAKNNSSYGKLVRASLFVLLASSIISTLIDSSFQAAIISLIAFISFDLICLFKKPKMVDHTQTIEQLVKQNKELEDKLKEVKGDISVVKISAGIGRK
jgi:hypothetical protein